MSADRLPIVERPWRIVLGIGILAVAVLSVTRYYQHLSIYKRAQQRDVDVEVGDTLCSPKAASWSSGAERAVVLFTSGTCAVCEAGRPFEDILVSAARERGIPVWFVVSTDRRQDGLAQDLVRRHLAVLRAAPSSLGISRVPTVFVVDNRDRVLSRWVGSVPTKRRDRLRDEMIAGTLPLDYERISAQDFSRSPDAASQQVLALGGSVNAHRGYHVMTLRDLYVRAQYEFDPARPVFVDCASAPSAYSCQSAAFELAVSGFKVVAVGLPRRHSGCVADH